MASAFECKTLYAASAATGYQLVFVISKTFVSALSRGGTFWVRPRPAGDTAGTLPTSPIPGAGAVADGWIRLGPSEAVNFGDASIFGVRRVSGGTMTTKFLDVWCEVQGDLVVVSA